MENCALEHAGAESIAIAQTPKVDKIEETLDIAPTTHIGRG